MINTDNSRKLQVILSYSLIVVSVVTLVLALGFMTNFYSLFVDGNSEMYQLFKDLQILNNAIFNASIICVIMSLGMIVFDITKKKVGITGVIYTFVLTVINTSNMLNVHRVNNYFAGLYDGIDFSMLEDYKASMLPFISVDVIFYTVTGLSVLVALVTLVNALTKNEKDGEADGK